MLPIGKVTNVALCPAHSGILCLVKQQTRFFLKPISTKLILKSPRARLRHRNRSPAQLGNLYFQLAVTIKKISDISRRGRNTC